MDQTTIAVLMQWAVHLSGYPQPPELPEVQYKPHSFFVASVCGNKECPIKGWYNDKHIVYVDESLGGVRLDSILVHEFTHYLQDLSGKYKQPSCPIFVAREREAYAVQIEYLTQVSGEYAGIMIPPLRCPG